MVIHPPVMFAGFASLSVPFAFAIAALWMKRWDGWVVRAMPWALFTFVTLGTAILMGGYWAYKTLGWGGYWAWDPVENTSLVPWLATVGARPRHVPPEGAREAPEDQHHPRDPRLLLHPLRHVPDALRRPRGLLGPLLRRPRDHRLARRHHRGLPRRRPRPPRLPLEGDPGRLRPRRRDGQGEGRALPLALGPLHPLRDPVQRLGPRHPPRHVRADPHAHRRQGVAGLDELLQRHARADRHRSWRSSSRSSRSSPGAGRRSPSWRRRRSSPPSIGLMGGGVAFSASACTPAATSRSSRSRSSAWPRTPRRRALRAAQGDFRPRAATSPTSASRSCSSGSSSPASTRRSSRSTCRRDQPIAGRAATR